MYLLYTANWGEGEVAIEQLKKARVNVKMHREVRDEASKGHGV